MAEDGPEGMADATEELYGLDPNDFVAARNELVRRLRKAGDRQLATEVGKLRRPTPAAWAVNQLARLHRADVAELLSLGEALRAAQEDALSGAAPADLRQASRARRDAVARLVARAEAVLGDRGGAGAHAGEVAATLEAASLDADAGAAVLAGRLSTELQPPSGFGPFDAPVVERRAAPEPPDVKPTGPPERKVREAEEAATEARRRWEERSAQSRAAVDRVAEVRRAAGEAEAEVARLEDLLVEAQRGLRAAVRDAELAEDAASQAEEATAEAAAGLREADQRLADLRGG